MLRLLPALAALLAFPALVSAQVCVPASTRAQIGYDGGSWIGEGLSYHSVSISAAHPVPSFGLPKISSAAARGHLGIGQVGGSWIESPYLAVDASLQYQGRLSLPQLPATSLCPVVGLAVSSGSSNAVNRYGDQISTLHAALPIGLQISHAFPVKNFRIEPYAAGAAELWYVKQAYTDIRMVEGEGYETYLHEVAQPGIGGSVRAGTEISHGRWSASFGARFGERIYGGGLRFSLGAGMTF